MKEIKPAILMFIIFTAICGGVYPAIVTGIASVAFPRQAKGSLVTDKTGQLAGSALIGQPFSDAKYFWPRPSATTDFGYNPSASGGSNAGPTNPDYLKTIGDRIKALHNAGISGSVPAELVQASASGLDPHITLEAANVQIARVARARGMSVEDLSRLVTARTEGRQLGFLGEPRINVLALNLELDKLR
jgi:potassium-transporting ATPase KdpC subunit